MSRCDPEACDKLNGKIPVQAASQRMVYDLSFCKGRKELMYIIDTINHNGWDVVSLSQSGDAYTVLHRRPAGA